jgi:precorrin isomerase
VEARESKESLWASGLVCITNIDRKGGTPATAAALNALLKIAPQRR